MSGPPTSDGADQQSGKSIITDLAYFALVAFLGWAKVIEGQAIVALLGFYGAGRVVTGARKNQAAQARAYSDGVASGRAARPSGHDRDDDDDDPDGPPTHRPGSYSHIATAPPRPPSRSGPGGSSSPLLALLSFLGGKHA